MENGVEELWLKMWSKSFFGLWFLSLNCDTVGHWRKLRDAISFFAVSSSRRISVCSYFPSMLNNYLLILETSVLHNPIPVISDGKKYCCGYSYRRWRCFKDLWYNSDRDKFWTHFGKSYLKTKIKETCLDLRFLFCLLILVNV